MKRLWLWLVVLAPLTGVAQPLLWSDEFDQPDGSPPNPSRWTYDLGGSGFGNHELQTYTTRTENVHIENGMLVIEARREDFAGQDGLTRAYTSARLKTSGLFSTRHGRIEARLKIPTGSGMWPAFWALGQDITQSGWPQCGEIDVMENIGREPTVVHATVHGPGYSGGQGLGAPYQLPSGAAFAQDFHCYSVDWHPQRMTFQVDGHTYHEVTPEKLPTGAPWVFEQPFFLIVNLAVGGDWPGPPDATTQFPQRMWVDYVRCYAAAD